MQWTDNLSTHLCLSVSVALIFKVNTMRGVCEAFVTMWEKLENFPSRNQILDVACDKWQLKFGMAQFDQKCSLVWVDIPYTG